MKSQKPLKTGQHKTLIREKRKERECFLSAPAAQCCGLPAFNLRYLRLFAD